MNKFEKIVRLGTQPEYECQKACVYCKIEYTGGGKGKLSIVGTIGPKYNGDAYGSSGQCYDEIKIKNHATGWDKKRVEKFVSIWKEWHLNNMRAGCEHQRKNWDTNKLLTITHYTVTMDAWAAKKKAEENPNVSIVEITNFVSTKTIYQTDPNTGEVYLTKHMITPPDDCEHSELKVVGGEGGLILYVIRAYC